MRLTAAITRTSQRELDVSGSPDCTSCAACSKASGLGSADADAGAGDGGGRWAFRTLIRRRPPTLAHRDAVEHVPALHTHAEAERAQGASASQRVAGLHGQRV